MGRAARPAAAAQPAAKLWLAVQKAPTPVQMRWLEGPRAQLPNPALSARLALEAELRAWLAALRWLSCRNGGGQCAVCKTQCSSGMPRAHNATAAATTAKPPTQQVA